jgi:hypothetical protein
MTNFATIRQEKGATSYAFQYGMNVGETIFKKLEHVRKLCVKNAYTELYENQTVVDTGSQTKGRTGSALCGEEIERGARINKRTVQDKVNEYRRLHVHHLPAALFYNLFGHFLNRNLIAQIQV